MRRITIIGIATVVLSYGTLLLVALRPAPLLGVHGPSLAHSVDPFADYVGGNHCAPRGDGEWKCSISPGSDGSAYRVEVHSVGCWSADRIGRSGTMPGKLDGCVSVFDYLRVFSRPLAVALFVIVGLWAIAFVPAGLVTLAKGQWLMFGIGWLTGGIVWWIAAAGLARPDSRWAQRFYEPRMLARSRERYPSRAAASG